MKTVGKKLSDRVIKVESADEQGATCLYCVQEF